MARLTNRQLGNVGNLGDILKHAALAELAAMLARTSGRVSYVETHAFKLRAPLADAERWSREVLALGAAHAGYARYAEVERTALALRGEYLCSAGLVLEVLGDARSCAVLAEANAATRTELSAQLSLARSPNVRVVDDATKVDADATVPSGGALLVHVDPFTLAPGLWPSLASALDAMVARSAQAALVAYRYSRNAGEPWPPALGGALGLVAETRGGPHALAVYATPSLGDAVARVADSLGWTRSAQRSSFASSTSTG